MKTSGFWDVFSNGECLCLRWRASLFDFLFYYLSFSDSFYAQFDLLFWLVWFHNKRNKNVDAIVSMWCSESLSLHLSGVKTTHSKPQNAWQKRCHLCVFCLFSFLFPKRTCMNTDTHPLTHLWLTCDSSSWGHRRTLFLLNRPRRADQPVHMTCAPLLLSGVPLTLTELHCTAPMLCLKQTAIHYVSETFPIVHPIVSFLGGLSKYSLWIYSSYAGYVKFNILWNTCR